MLTPDEKLFLTGHFVTRRGRTNRAYTGKYGFGIFRTERKRTKNFQRARVCKTAVTLRRPHRPSRSLRRTTPPCHCDTPSLSLRRTTPRHCGAPPPSLRAAKREANQPRPSSLRRTTPRHCGAPPPSLRYALTVIASSE